MSKVVLDASAVLALLKGERGGAKVAGVLADAAIGSFNLAEVISHFGARPEADLKALFRKEGLI